MHDFQMVIIGTAKSDLEDQKEAILAIFYDELDNIDNQRTTHPLSLT